MADAPDPVEDIHAPGAQVKPRSSFGAELAAPRADPPAILGIPFVGPHLMYALYVMLFVPLMYMQEAARDHDWPRCAMVGVAWAIAFPPLAWVFHRRSMVHVGISIFAWVAVVVGFPMAALLYA